MVKVGDKTRVTASPPGLLDGGVANHVSVNWTAGGSAHSGSWTFTTLAYTTLPEWLARNPGTGTNPGFTMRVHQLNTFAWTQNATLPNRWLRGDQWKRHGQPRR